MVLVATVAVGTAIALSQIAQGPIALAIVGIVSLAWFASPIAALWRVWKLRTGRGTPNVVTMVGLAVAAVGAAHLTLLGLVRIARGDSALVWNVDYRYYLSQAQAIARHADLGTALDYLGARIDYHVGPAWIAGSFGHFLGWGIPEVSFVAVPLMTAIVTVAGGAALCSRLGADPRAAVVAPGVLLVIPAVIRDGFGVLEFPYLRDTDMFQFSASMMLNSQFAWALGIASVALLAATRPRLVWCGAVGLATLTLSKPQFFIGFMVVAVAVGVVLAFDRDERPGAWRGHASALAAAGVVGLLLLTNVQGSAGELLGSPQLRPFDTGLGLLNYRGTALLLFVVVTVIVLTVHTARALRVLRAAVLVGSLGVGMVAFLSVVLVPTSAAGLASARKLGVTGWSVFTQQGNVAQAIVPVGIVVALMSLAGLMTLALRSGRRGAFAVVAVACIAAFAPIPLMVTAARFPTGQYAYEAVDDEPLAKLLDTVPDEGSVIVVSDLADPAQDYREAC